MNVAVAQAFGGGPLEGRKVVRLAFTDEGGISRDEPFAVIAGVFVHSDDQLVPRKTNLSDWRKNTSQRKINAIDAPTSRAVSKKRLWRAASESFGSRFVFWACGGRVRGVLPVDLHISGCPPSPTQLLRGLLALLEPQRDATAGRHRGDRAKTHRSKRRFIENTIWKQ